MKNLHFFFYFTRVDGSSSFLILKNIQSNVLKTGLCSISCLFSLIFTCSELRAISFPCALHTWLPFAARLPAICLNGSAEMHAATVSTHYHAKAYLFSVSVCFKERRRWNVYLRNCNSVNDYLGYHGVSMLMLIHPGTCSISMLKQTKISLTCVWLYHTQSVNTKCSTLGKHCA